MVVLVGGALGAAGALAVVAAGRLTPGPGAATVASLYPVIVGVLFGTWAHLVVQTVGLFDRFGWKVLPVVFFGVIYAVSMQWGWQVEPRLWAVVRRRASVRAYFRARARPWLLKTGARFAAIWVTAVLVFGWAAAFDFAWATFQRALDLVGA